MNTRHISQYPLTLARAAALAAVLPLVAATAQANSGYGVDTSLGNALNPSGTPAFRLQDPDGLGIQQHSRTPTGFLVMRPFEVTETKTSASGWTTSGWAEVGGLLNSGLGKDAAKLLEYKDVRSSAQLSAGLQMEKAASAMFVDITAGALGRRDQFLGVNFGKYNSWRVKTFYKQTPHVFTSTYRSLWNNVGSSSLTLATLPPGGTTSAAVTDINIGNAALATPYSTLKITRDKGGVKAELRPADHWTAYVSYTNEHRTGARPFGLVSAGGGGTGGVETPESIDYTTHDFIAGLQFSDGRNSLNASISASMFRNHIDTLTIENPLFLAAANGINAFPRAVFDMYPDNNFYSTKVEYARSMPKFWNGNFTLLASSSSSRQNDRLIPYTPYAGAVVNAVTGGSWETTAALYKQSADARIDSKLADATLSLHPVALLDLRAKVRLYQTTNDKDYLVCNPLTGQWGRLINDGSANTIVNTPAYLAAGVRCNIAATAALGVAPSAGNFNIRSIPFAYKQRNYELDGDLHLGRASTVTLSVEREEFTRKIAERDRTNENRFKIGYVDRSFGFGSLRLSVETDRRRGSTYNSDPFAAYYSTSLGPFPTATGTTTNQWIRTNDLFRKYDQADRDQNVLNARFNFMIGETIDVGLSAQLKDVKYPESQQGRDDHHKVNSAGLDLNWQPRDDTNLYASYNYQSGRMHQTNLQTNANCAIGTTYFFLSNGLVQTTAISAAQIAAGLTQVGSNLVTATNYVPLCGTVAPLSPLYPTSRTWTATHDDRSRSFNIGGSYDLHKVRLAANITETRGTSGIQYTYNPDALGFTPAQVALIGSGFPENSDKRTTVDANVIVPLNKKLTMRLYYLYEADRIRDWHYDGVAANPTPNTNQMTFLDSGPQDYHVNVVGVFFSAKL